MDHFRLLSLPAHKPDYNIPPGQKILAVVQMENGSNRAVNLYWRLIPPWAKDRAISSRLINAGAKTLTERPSFKNAYRHRRCLIPATGFFEWQSTGSPAPGQIATCTPSRAITTNSPITYISRIMLYSLLQVFGSTGNTTRKRLFMRDYNHTAANAKITPIHDRMPVIIAPDDYNRWLTKKTTVVEMADFLAADAFQSMQITRSAQGSIILCITMKVVYANSSRKRLFLLKLEQAFPTYYFFLDSVAGSSAINSGL